MNDLKLDRLDSEFDKDYQSLLEKYEKDKKNLINERANNIPDEVKEVATELHTHKCTSNHVDQCDWYYDEDKWTSYVRKKYLEIANELIDEIGYECAMKTISIIYR